MDNKILENEMCRLDTDEAYSNATNGEISNDGAYDDVTASCAEIVPEHPDELPDIDKVEDFVGGDRVYDEETAGALAALMFAKAHPEEESASKVAIEEEQEAPKVRVTPAAVLIVISVVLMELLSGLSPILLCYTSIPFFASNTKAGSDTLGVAMDGINVYSSSHSVKANPKDGNADSSIAAMSYGEPVISLTQSDIQYSARTYFTATSSMNLESQDRTSDKTDPGASSPEDEFKVDP